jgi:hypothetical protein
MTLFRTKSQKPKQNVAQSQTPARKHVVTILGRQLTVSKDEEVPKKIVIHMRGPEEGKPETVLELLLDEEVPLTEEEKRVHFKSPKNVMAARKIRQLMNSHTRTMLKKQLKTSSDCKTKFVVGLALTLQIVAIILIFI